MKLILAAILLISVTLVLATTPASQDHTHEVKTEWNAFKVKIIIKWANNICCIYQFLISYYQITRALQREFCYRIEGCTCFNILIFHWQGKHKKAYGALKRNTTTAMQFLLLITKGSTSTTAMPTRLTRKSITSYPTW